MKVKNRQEESLEERIKNITLLAVDLDGVLTDGTITIDSNGKASKSVNYLDRDAINFWRENNKFAIITGGGGFLQETIVNFIGCDYCIYKARNKEKALVDMCEKLGIDVNNVCYIGDAERDLPAIKASGFGMTPKNGATLCKDESDLILDNIGGHGCVNEAIEFLSGIKLL